jgi:hypothetical protein
MSANRSVQAAQRRRAGPTNSEPAIPGRGPQTSIHSAQMFANQARPGNGPNIPNGRLAGQQAALQQQQNQQMYQQERQQQQQSQSQDKLSSVNKMTIPQAITLITLRLGVIENKLMHMPEGGAMDNMNMNMDGNIDAGLFQSFISRLDSLEKRSASTSGSTPELNLLKQQFDNFKQTAVQTKNSVIALSKENVALKTQVENMHKELIETKELLNALQNLTIEHSHKILDLSGSNELLPMDNNENFDENDTTELEHAIYDNENEILDYDNETIGNNLKKLIESELHM